MVLAGGITIGTGITLAGVAIAVIGALALAVVYFRANLGKSTIDLYRQDNDALRARVKTQDEDLAAKDRLLADKDKVVAELKTTLTEKDTQIQNITDIATGATAITALRKADEREHKAILDGFNLLQQTLVKLVKPGKGGGDSAE